MRATEIGLTDRPVSDVQDSRNVPRNASSSLDLGVKLPHVHMCIFLLDSTHNNYQSTLLLIHRDALLFSKRHENHSRYKDDHT